MPTVPVTNPSRYPTVTLGGVDWPVPPLALKQNRVLQPIFNRVAIRILDQGVKVSELTEADFSDLTTIAFHAISRGHPSFTVEEMDEMPIGVIELVGVLLVAMEQSGLFRPKAAGAGESEGEASPQTGIAS